MKSKNLTRTFLLTATFLFSLSSVFAQKTVALDNWYNHEKHSKTGKIFHYTWEDKEFSGFSTLGDIFKNQGAVLKTIGEAPSAENLKGAGVYIIVDPDTTSENPNPNYVQPPDIKVIKKWVKKGGVLLIMTNDAPNTEFTHFNKLAREFGFTFQAVTLNPVTGRNWEMGAETQFPDHPLFAGVKKIYMKEVSSILLSKKAKPVLFDYGSEDVIIAETNYGKGYVLAIGDPWLYNEYIGHLLLPQDFDNGKAAVNLVSLLLGKAK